MALHKLKTTEEKKNVKKEEKQSKLHRRVSEGKHEFRSTFLKSISTRCNGNLAHFW